MAKKNGKNVKNGKKKLDSIKLKLGTRVYVGSTPDRAVQKIDSLTQENVKLKIELKKK